MLGLYLMMALSSAGFVEIFRSVSDNDDDGAERDAADNDAFPSISDAMSDESIVGLAGLFEDDSEDDGSADRDEDIPEDDTPDSDDTPESDSGPNVVDVSTQGASVFGTDGDDIIDVTGYEVDSINARDGDDLIYTERSSAGFGYDAVVNGGAGDDVIVEQYYENHSTLNGGDGDDMILGGMGLASGGDGEDILVGTTLDGGAGNDTLFAYSTVHGNGAGVSTGGAGDDYINVTAASAYDYGVPSVTGGEGDDIFNVDIHAQSPHSTDARGDGVDVIITDFDRTEDVLQISLPQEDDFGFANFDDYALDGITVEQDGDDSLITVSFVYDGPALDYERPDQATIIRVQGVSDLTLDEIVMEDNTDYVAVEQPDFSVYGDGESDSEGEGGSDGEEDTSEDDTVGGSTEDGTSDDETPDDETPDADNSGDDEIFIDGPTFYDGGYGLHIRGGDGNDTISGDARNSEHVTIHGDAGDDVLDGSVMNNVSLYGGDGDDVLILSSHAPGGTGYWAVADGGYGDDRLILDVPPQEGGSNLPRLTGGAGNDVFDIRFDERFTVHGGNNGAEYTAWGDDDFPDRSYLAILSDFNPDEDAIEIDLNIHDPVSTITSATLEIGPATDVYSSTPRLDPRLSSEGGEETRLIVTYENDAGDEREMVVIVKATGLTWDNIDFVGEHTPAVLQVA